MEGRPLREAFVNGPAPFRIVIEDHTAATADGSYSVTAKLTTVGTGAGAFRYLDFAKVQRK